MIHRLRIILKQTYSSPYVHLNAAHFFYRQKVIRDQNTLKLTHALEVHCISSIDNNSSEINTNSRPCTDLPVCKQTTTEQTHALFAVFYILQTSNSFCKGELVSRLAQKGPGKRDSALACKQATTERRLLLCVACISRLRRSGPAPMQGPPGCFGVPCLNQKFGQGGFVLT